jgi:hypothetical protein
MCGCKSSLGEREARRRLYFLKQGFSWRGKHESLLNATSICGEASFPISKEIVWHIDNH